MSNVIKLEFGKPTEPVAAGSTYDESRETIRAAIVKTLIEEQFGQEIADAVAHAVARAATESIQELDRLGSFSTSVDIPPGLDVDAACHSAVAQIKEQMGRQITAILAKSHTSIGAAAMSGCTALAYAITASLSKG